MDPGSEGRTRSFTGPQHAFPAWLRSLRADPRYARKVSPLEGGKKKQGKKRDPSNAPSMRFSLKTRANVRDWLSQ